MRPRRLSILLSDAELALVRAAAGDVPLSRYARRLLLADVAYQAGMEQVHVERNEAAREAQREHEASA